MSDRTSPNYKLWKHLQDNHGLTCIESELDEITSIVFGEVYALKPCPFCSSLSLRTKMSEDRQLYCVICINCHTEGPTGKSQEYARYRWNIRREASDE